MSFGNKKILLIGGAPRSGTTLLSNLLDNHPECLVFPFEHSTLEQFYWNQGNEEFFKSEFINNRRNGQQSILANPDFIKNYEKKIADQYNKEFSINIDTNAFRKGYLEYLDSNEITLENILRALMNGLAASNTYAKNKLATAKYLVFKQPFYTELFAQFSTKYLSNTKYIHIRRNPIARYTSAKKRRLVIQQLNGKKLTHINKVNFTLGHTQVDLASIHLSQENQKRLGQDCYKMANYEEMIQDPTFFFKSLCEYLNIDHFSDFFKVPTQLGKPVEAGSTFVKKTGLDKSATDRSQQYYKLTNKAERTVHQYYLGLSGWNEQKVSKLQFLIANLQPHKHTMVKHYFFQILLTFLQLSKTEKQIIEAYLEGLKKRTKGVNGAT